MNSFKSGAMLCLLVNLHCLVPEWKAKAYKDTFTSVSMSDIHISPALFLSKI